MYNSEIYKIIADSYNRNNYYEKYRRDRTLTVAEEWVLDAFMHDMPEEHPKVLDVGCGDARLYDEYLYNKGCCITGIDISEEQIKRARKNLPACNFIVQNFLDSTPNYKNLFSGVICMYALFNFIEDDQPKAIQRIYDFLKPGGVALLNVRTEIYDGVKFQENWCGAPMYWSLSGVDQVFEWCQKVGFICSVANNPDNADYKFLLLLKPRSII